MPASPLPKRLENLVRLSQSLVSHCPSDPARTTAAQHFATRLPLTHAAPQGKLRAILDSQALLSQLQVGGRRGDAEAILETEDDVFLYIGAFSYPGTECGFLFVPSLEAGRQDDAIATPFDSGALVGGKGVTHPATYADGLAYVREHELPVSGYRALLARVIADYSDSPGYYLNEPGDFVCACGEKREHPFGLSGGDRRAGTFEVRLPQRVPLHPPHLRAVFVRKGYELPELSVLFASGITIERYEADSTDPDFFHALRSACISFIQEHLIP
jgi:hypothetical protein